MVISPARIGWLSLLLVCFLLAGCGGGGPVGASDQSSLSVLRGQAFVQTQSTGAEALAAAGQTLPEGAKVRTGPSAHALITFLDGSTIELEELTTLTVSRARSSDAGTEIRVDQAGGRVWARVAALTDQRSRFEIASPTAVAAVRGSLIGAAVAPDDVMTCWVIEGTMYVTAQGQEVRLAPGQESVTPPGQPPGPPRDRPLAQSMLRVRWSGDSFVRLVDPVGRSIGIAPPGVEVNQIRNALSSRPGQQPAFIDVPAPLGGEYSLVIENPQAGGQAITLQYEQAGQRTVASYTDPVPAGARYVATVRLQPADATAPLSIGSLTPLTGTVPGTVIVRDRESGRPSPAAVTPAPTLPVQN